MNAKIIIPLVLFVIALPLSVFLFLKWSDQNTSDKRPVSQHILALTQPVMSFSGVVDKVDGHIITLTQVLPPTDPALIPPATTNLALPPSPTPAPSPLTYQVVVSDQTQISQPPTQGVNYLFKKNVPPDPLSLSLTDVVAGLYLTVSSKEDLRTLTDDSFEAIMITLPEQIIYLNGKITGVKGNELIIKASPPALLDPRLPATAQQDQEYTITITPDTEISRMSVGVGLNPERLSLSDLKADMQVAVYTGTDVTQGTQFTALRLEPMQAPALLAPPLAPPIQ
jgi:hypothetical protein